MTTKSMRFLPAGKDVPIKGEASVLELALKHDVPLSHSCGGMGSCTTCRVIVLHADGPLAHREEMEQDLAEMRGFADDERLACQLRPTAGLVVRVPGTT